jgi:glucose-6-phosphate isomerase
MAFAGINILDILSGVRNAQEKFLVTKDFDNEAYLYAATRYLINKKQDIEVFASYDADLLSFNE